MVWTRNVKRATPCANRTPYSIVLHSWPLSCFHSCLLLMRHPQYRSLLTLAVASITETVAVYRLVESSPTALVTSVTVRC